MQKLSSASDRVWIITLICLVAFTACAVGSGRHEITFTPVAVAPESRIQLQASARAVRPTPVPSELAPYFASQLPPTATPMIFPDATPFVYPTPWVFPSQQPERMVNGVLINPLLNTPDRLYNNPFPSPFAIENDVTCEPELLITHLRDLPTETQHPKQLNGTYVIKTRLYYVEIQDTCPETERYRKAHYFEFFSDYKTLYNYQTGRFDLPFRTLFGGCFQDSLHRPLKIFALILLDDGSLVKSQELDVAFDDQESCDRDERLTPY